MTRTNERLAVIQRVYTAWAAEQGDIAPDPRYATAGESQYPEGIEALSAPLAAQAELQRRTEEALRAAGLPVTV